MLVVWCGMGIGDLLTWVSTALQFVGGGAAMIWPKHRWIGWGTFGVGVLIVVVSVARFLFPDLAAGYERLRDTLFLIPLGTAIGIVATLAAVATWRRITTPAALVHPALRMKGWAKMVQIAIEYDPSNPV
jgi:hypothetical protein